MALLDIMFIERYLVLSVLKFLRWQYNSLPLWSSSRWATLLVLQYRCSLVHKQNDPGRFQSKTWVNQTPPSAVREIIYFFPAILVSAVNPENYAHCSQNQVMLENIGETSWRRPFEEEIHDDLTGPLMSKHSTWVHSTYLRSLSLLQPLLETLRIHTVAKSLAQQLSVRHGRLSLVFIWFKCT